MNKPVNSAKNKEEAVYVVGNSILLGELCDEKKLYSLSGQEKKTTIGYILTLLAVCPLLITNISDLKKRYTIADWLRVGGAPDAIIEKLASSLNASDGRYRLFAVKLFFDKAILLFADTVAIQMLTNATGEHDLLDLVIQVEVDLTRSGFQGRFLIEGVRDYGKPCLYDVWTTDETRIIIDVFHIKDNGHSFTYELYFTQLITSRRSETIRPYEDSHFLIH